MGNTRKRYVFIDILKGILIILVVYGHILLGVVSYLSSVYIEFVPYNLCLCFCGAYFFGLGNCFKRFLYMTKYEVGSNAVWIFLAGILISLLYLIEPRQTEWFINKVPSLIFYVSPLGAILSLSVLSIAVERIGFRKIINFSKYVESKVI